MKLSPIAKSYSNSSARKPLTQPKSAESQAHSTSPSEIPRAENRPVVGVVKGRDRPEVGVGDREATKNALAGFLADKTLSANQIEFANMIIEHFTAHGILDGQGPDGLFTHACR